LPGVKREPQPLNSVSLSLGFSEGVKTLQANG
jgi:hypothetical protein